MQHWWIALLALALVSATSPEDNDILDKRAKFERDPGDTELMFSLAAAYELAQDYSNALKFYTLRMQTTGGHIPQVWYSCYKRAGILQVTAEWPIANAAYMNCYRLDDRRMEPLWQIAREYLYHQEDFALAAGFLHTAVSIPIPPHDQQEDLLGFEMADWMYYRYDDLSLALLKAGTQQSVTQAIDVLNMLTHPPKKKRLQDIKLVFRENLSTLLDRLQEAAAVLDELTSLEADKLMQDALADDAEMWDRRRGNQQAYLRELEEEEGRQAQEDRGLDRERALAREDVLKQVNNAPKPPPTPPKSDPLSESSRPVPVVVQQQVPVPVVVQQQVVQQHPDLNPRRWGGSVPLPESALLEQERYLVEEATDEILELEVDEVKYVWLFGAVVVLLCLTMVSRGNKKKDN